MGYEIERKFLVKGDYRPDVFKSYTVKQGYLSVTCKGVVRVRINEEQAFITVKSATEVGVLKRHEWEYEIPVGDAEEMLQLCRDGVIDKTRHLVNAGRHVVEVDEFHGNNKGLIIAEVELAYESEQFEKPAWLGEEVTGNERYYNSFLATHPFSTWNR